MANIRQNLAFVFFSNAAGIPIATDAPHPVFGILLSSVSVIGNALRLSRLKIEAFPSARLGPGYIPNLPKMRRDVWNQRSLSDS